MLLVATPVLLDPNFADTVVLMLDVDDRGRPRSGAQPADRAVPVSEVLGDWGEVVAEPEVLFQGGPVEHRGRLGGRPAAAPPTTCRSASARSTGPLGLLDLDTPVELVDRLAGRAADLRRVRRLGAPTSWRRRSTRALVRRARPRRADVFRSDPASCGATCCAASPASLPWHSTRPVDPDLN